MTRTEVREMAGKNLPADRIASMADKQALIVCHQFTGVSPSSMLEPVVS